MSRWSRRDFLRNAALLGASAALAPRLARAANAPAAAGRPRALVQFHLGGGMDQILTTNPRRKAELDPTVDLPYGEEGIKKLGALEVGPLFHRLEKYVPKMAIVNGVVGATVAHKTGNIQVQHMRRFCPTNGVGLVGTIGALRGGDCPVHDVRFVGGGVQSPPTEVLSAGRSLQIKYNLREPEHGLVDQLATLAADDVSRPRVLAALEAELARCGADPGCMPVDTARAVLARLPHQRLAPPPRLVPDDAYPAVFKGYFGGAARRLEASLRDALHLLEHQITPAVFVAMPANWDTHAHNLSGQEVRMNIFAPCFLWFLDELGRRRTKDGALLSDQVGIVVSSELGRFPVLNEFAGKDHFPEFPAIFMGPGIRPGKYGETDKRMISTPISLQTGRPSGSAKDDVPTIDDLGTTILQWFGIEDTTSLGYLGRRLDFLLG